MNPRPTGANAARSGTSSWVLAWLIGSALICPAGAVLAYDQPIGTHDASSCAVTAGWACDPDAYEQALTIHIFDGAQGTGGRPALIKKLLALRQHELPFVAIRAEALLVGYADDEAVRQTLGDTAFSNSSSRRLMPHPEVYPIGLTRLRS
jgi:hypothetical protein